MTPSDPTLARAPDPLDSPRVLALRQRVGFDAALAAERSDQQVEIKAEDFPAPEALGGWDLERDVTQLPQSESRLQLRFRQGEARVTIRLHAFPGAERQRVAARLLQRADAVTAEDLTDTRGPADLGTLSLMPAPSTSQVVYWIYRNVYAEVTTFKTELGAVDIARAVHGELVARTTAIR